MKSKLIFLLLLLSITFNLKAQNSGFLNGYIITNSNDTINGLVKYVNQVPYRVLDEIKFKENDDSKTAVYPPGSIIGYKAGGKVFHSLKNPTYGERQFMELVIDGYVKLYTSTVTSFGVSQYGGANSSSSFLLKTGDKILFSVSKGKFKDRLSEYFLDNSSIAEKIKNQEYKERDIEWIVREYNESKKVN